MGQFTYIADTTGDQLEVFHNSIRPVIQLTPCTGVSERPTIQLDRDGVLLLMKELIRFLENNR